MSPPKPAEILLAAYDTGTQLPPLSQSASMSVPEAYAIAAEIIDARLARGETPVGRKIGFTNRSIWPLYNVDAPMWAPMYDSTVAPLPEGGVAVLPNRAEPRIEPEIAFKFSATPQSGMDLEEIAACIDWMAHGIEIVTSPYPGWKFALTDCIAAQSLHGCFWYGPPRPLPADLGALERFTLQMTGPRGTLNGHARDVLDGPLHAIRFLLDEIAKMPGATPIQPGEIVTTGTLTDAGPVTTGEHWVTTLDGIDLPGIDIRFT